MESNVAERALPFFSVSSYRSAPDNDAGQQPAIDISLEREIASVRNPLD
jgi:hypothetical protein